MTDAEDTLPEIKEATKAVDRWASWTRWFERLTFASLVAGFVWAIAGPLLLEQLSHRYGNLWPNTAWTGHLGVWAFLAAFWLKLVPSKRRYLVPPTGE